jgi:hypothetical protein
MPRPRIGQDGPLNIRPPRPIWQIREELALLKTQRPPNRDVLALTSWNLVCERLQMWLDLDLED